MIQSSQITPGMTLSISDKLYKVESVVKVSVAKGTPFIKTKLRDLALDKEVEKSFKPNQEVEDVALLERTLEFLYPEGKDYLCLAIDTLEQILIAAKVMGDKTNYLKEGTELKASFYGDTVFAIELPQFLEIMISKIEGSEDAGPLSNTNLVALLETGARVEVPSFVEVGDIIKVDTKTNEYIQRV